MNPARATKSGWTCVYRFCQRGIETAAIRIAAMFDDGGRNAMCSGDVQSFRIHAIADHRRDAAGQLRFQQGLHIAAAAGDQNDDFFHLFLALMLYWL